MLASSIATAQATLIPTMGLLPAPIKPIISTCAGTELEPANCASECILPIDIGLIGIGENGHIAFNDPPADFDTKEAYIIVNLDERCKKQQMGEGWFATIDDVPKQAVSMTCYQIMQCERIVSCVPYAVKAEAVENTVKATETTNHIPATLLKEHPDFILYVDEDSAKGIMK